MPDVLVHFDEPQLSADGRMFSARVMGSRLPTGLWEAWIEFEPRIGGESVRTARETEQLSRGDLRFWAAGITRAQLQSALARALAAPTTVIEPRPAGVSQAADDDAELESTFVRSEEPVLDPVDVYTRSGEYCLRQELRAMDARQLAAIIAAHHIKEMDVTDLARTYEDALAERIVAGVQHNVDSSRNISAQPDANATK